MEIHRAETERRQRVKGNGSKESLGPFGPAGKDDTGKPADSNSREDSFYVAEATGTDRSKPSVAAAAFILLIKIYRVIVSPWVPATCRYVPTCSQYGLDAMRIHGALGGSWLTIKRISRCHPLGGSGHDPVPFKDELNTEPRGATAANAKGAYNG